MRQLRYKVPRCYISDAQKEAIEKCYSRTGSIKLAADFASVSNNTAWRHLKKNNLLNNPRLAENEGDPKGLPDSWLFT